VRVTKLESDGEFVGLGGHRYLYLLRPMFLVLLSATIVWQFRVAVASLPFVGFLLFVAIQDFRVHVLSVRRIRLGAESLTLTPQFGSPRSDRWESVREIRLVDRRMLARPRRLLLLHVENRDYFMGSDLSDFDDLIRELSSRSGRGVEPFTGWQKFLWLQWGA
jgi:hypothetical protein